MNLDFRQLGSKHLTLCRDINLSSKTKEVFTLLTLCLTALAGVTSIQAASATTDGSQHLVCVKSGQHFICEPEAQTNQELATNNDSEIKGTIAQPLNSAQQDFLANNFLWLSYLLPGGLALGLFLHDRYAGYRTAVLSAQIQTLERLWKHSPRS